VKLRKLDIVGFKSFADPVRLRFYDGTTGIVGPNGCGKSNIVDAIRWVMGEQSPRRLRGKSMEDVIFAGSESKPATGMAEVQLTFENDGRNLPPEYASLPEISVGRRLFRSGESEYFINKTPCRLRDVQELFMGTGVGTKAYSIIGQGSIGLLVAQSPAERRGLIEEVAGISKYNSRKRLAENKMERTRQNLQRVNDIVGELQRSLNSLKRQARKAARYKKVREQLLDVELHQATHRYLELQVMQNQYRQKTRSRRDEHAAVTARVATIEADIEQARVSLLEDEKKLSTLQEKLYSTDNQIKLCEKNIEFLGRESESLSGGGQQATQEVERLRGELELVDASIAELEESHRQLQQNAHMAEQRYREQENSLQQHLQQMQVKSRQFEQQQQQQRHLAEQAVELRARLESIDQSLVELQGSRAQNQAELEALQQSRRELDNQHSQQAQRLEQSRQMHLNLVQRREVSQNELAELQVKTRENEARLAGLGEEIARRRSRLESLRQIERNYEGCHQGVQWVMKHAREANQDEQEGLEVVGLVADLLQTPPRYETAVQAVLGERLQGVVVKSHQAGLQAVDVLKREAEGRSSFIPVTLRSYSRAENTSVNGPKVIGPMSTLVQYQAEYASVVDYLLGDVVVVEDLPAAMAIWSANGHQATLVTLDGDVLEPQGVLTGGSLEGAGAHLLKNKRQIRELEQSLQHLEAEYRMAQDRQGKLKAELTMAQSTLESLRQNTHNEELRIIDQEKDLGHLQQQKSSLDERLARLRQEGERLDGRIAQLRQRRQQLLQERQANEQQQAGLLQQVEEMRRHIDLQNSQLAQMNQRVLDLKVEATTSSERAESCRQNLHHQQQRRQELAARLEAARAQITSGNQRLAECREKIKRTRGEISQLLDGKEKLQQEHDAARVTYDNLVAQVGEQELILKDLRRRSQQLGEELAEMSADLRELQLEQLHLVADTRRVLRVELTDCLSDYHLRPPPGPEQEQQAEKLRQVLERMGEVNPHALEEYEENLKRFDFLTSQSRDLNEALEKLQKVILKINRTSRKRFREAFEATNEKFQQVFPRLFNGGKAHLQLEEGKDLLEAGVEIVVRPPGKKLQNMELLSGGEKALTAVALLFALFLVKPTPFCLLDEVDAPMDEANLDRFNSMVRALAASSQFVIITHSKRTMELVDHLYGITMEEAGISKVVSVRLTSADQEQQQREAAAS